MDQQRVDKACKAFCETERYCPRPHSRDPVAQELWQAFGERYLATAKKFINNVYSKLPRAFFQAVISQLKASDPQMQSGSVRREASLELGSQRARGGAGRNDGGVDRRGGRSRGGIGNTGRGDYGGGRSRGGRGSTGSRGDTGGARGFREESRTGSGSFEKRYDQPWR